MHRPPFFSDDEMFRIASGVMMAAMLSVPVWSLAIWSLWHKQ